ncbi:hypothetical protein IEQ34_005751 [Dendrobium chrysotoxum]|uniref:Uncharacterized protein n=1 Tax=Dendrobium chrysotoxum TaxID=161865 RepID=A0AAV7HDY1_DENCH|nr:hypothetical protein IEQ34_005751 [Dendrobium chrysotoxum]
MLTSSSKGSDIQPRIVWTSERTQTNTIAPRGGDNIWPMEGQIRSCIRLTIEDSGSHQYTPMDNNINLHRLHVRLLLLLLGYDDTKHPILHGCFRLIHLHVLRQWELAEELTVASLKSMPAMVLLLLLPLLLAADLEDAAFHDLDLNLLLFDAREIGLDDVSLQLLLLVEA